LVALGRKAEAVRYAEASRGLNEPDWQIAQACEAILLSSGMSDVAYERYAVQANQATTNTATFRAIAKKYPTKSSREILNDLVLSQPGAEGKWFAASKEAGLFNLAIELANRSPADSRTLARAARDYGEKQPDFAVEAGLAALKWIARGHGYDITAADVLGAHAAIRNAALGASLGEPEINARVLHLTQGEFPGARFLAAVLAHPLKTSASTASK
jgi:hypothetical protein